LSILRRLTASDLITALVSSICFQM